MRVIAAARFRALRCESLPPLAYTASMAGTVSVVIVTFNGRALLGSCLSALFGGTRIPEEVIVVDNASTDGTIPWLTRTYPSVRVIPCAANLGFASANNRGIAASCGSAILTLNND